MLGFRLPIARRKGAGIAASSGSNYGPPSSLLTSLISYWKLDEASGTRVDVAGGNDLTDNNTVTQAAGVKGTDTAAQFTSANSETLSHVDNAGLSTGDIDFTLGVWVLADTLVSGGGIVQKGGGAGTHEYDLFYRGTSSQFAFRIANTTLLVNAATLGTPSTGVWYCIFAWHDSAANTINIQANNGTVDSVATAGVAPADTAGLFEFGKSEVSASYWNGRIARAGFWKRVLTASERTAFYGGGTPPDYPF